VTPPQRAASLPATPSAVKPLTPVQKPPSPAIKPIAPAPSPAAALTQSSKVPLPATPTPTVGRPAVAKPPVAVVQPNIPTILRPNARSKTLQDALKNLALPRTPIEPTAIPDVPAVIKPRPYGSIPTSQPFYLPEKPPEGLAPLATQIQEHLKKRPPIHEPDEVIGEDVSIKDAKER
jgi:hypothetical protein